MKKEPSLFFLKRLRGDGEEERGSGGREARGNRHSLTILFAAFVFVKHSSHFSLQPSLSAVITENRKV